MYKLPFFLKSTKFITGLAILSILLQCSPKFNYEVKSFLFDGVPKPYNVEVTILKDSLINDIKTNNELPTKSIPNVVSVNEFNLHPPYQDRKCSTCHNSDSMGKTRLPIPQLCNECHEDYTKKHDIIHGPVSSGSCTKCHEPHKSKLKKLLVKDGQDLCFNCHNATRLIEETIHTKIGSTSCITCHNPHGGSNSLLLQSGSCYNCHDNFEKKFTFLHGPVASGNCSKCHGTHQKKTTYNLTISGENLCLQCHNSEEVYKIDGHEKDKKISCTKCHNPHGGLNANFMYNLSPNQ